MMLATLASSVHSPIHAQRRAAPSNQRTNGSDEASARPPAATAVQRATSVATAVAVDAYSRATDLWTFLSSGTSNVGAGDATVARHGSTAVRTSSGAIIMPLGGESAPPPGLPPSPPASHGRAPPGGGGGGGKPLAPFAVRARAALGGARPAPSLARAGSIVNVAAVACDHGAPAEARAACASSSEGSSGGSRHGRVPSPSFEPELLGVAPLARPRPPRPPPPLPPTSLLPRGRALTNPIVTRTTGAPAPGRRAAHGAEPAEEAEGVEISDLPEHAQATEAFADLPIDAAQRARLNRLVARMHRAASVGRPTCARRAPRARAPRCARRAPRAHALRRVRVPTTAAAHAGTCCARARCASSSAHSAGTTRTVTARCRALSCGSS